MRSNRVWSLIVLAVCLPGVLASGAVYHVAPGGTDTNPGTAGQPWRTMQKGANTAAPGDTVLVGAGIYDERVVIQRPGITFRADGAVTNRSTFSVRASDITIDGFEMTCDGSNTIYRTAVFVSYGEVANVSIINNHIHDTPVVHPRGLIHFDTQNATSATSGFVISNNIVYNFGGPMVFINGRGHLVANNWISNSYGADCFNVQGRDHVFRGNYSTQIGTGIVNVWGAGDSAFDGPYYDDIARRTATSPTYGMWTNQHGKHIVRSHAIWQSKGWSNAVNVVDPTHSQVLASAGSFHGQWTLHDSRMVRAFSGGIGAITHADYVEAIGPLVYPHPPVWGRFASNIVFENNMIINCPGGSVVMYGANYTNVPGPVVDWTFRNNVWAWVEVSGGISVPYTRFYNNTFYQCVTNGGPVLAFGLYHTNYHDARGMALFSEVKSNAFIGCGRGAGHGWYGVTAIGEWSTNAYPGFPMDTVLTNCNYNYVGEVDGSPKLQGVGYPSTNRFRFSEPNGINGGYTALMNPLAGDFRIGPGSVLTNGGVIVGAFDPLLSNRASTALSPPSRLRLISPP